MQDEQVTWAQHGHSHTPLLGASKLDTEIAVFGHKYHSVLLVCPLHVQIKIATACAKK